MQDGARRRERPTAEIYALRRKGRTTSSEEKRARAAERKRRHLQDEAAGIVTLPIRVNGDALGRALRAERLLEPYEEDHRDALAYGLQRIVDAWLAGLKSYPGTRSDATARNSADSVARDSTDNEDDPAC